MTAQSATTRARSPLVWGSAVLFLGTVTAGLVGAAVWLWRAVDVEALVQGGAEPPPAVAEVVPQILLPDLPRTAGWTVHLLDSKASARFFPDPEYYSSLAERWERVLGDAGAQVERVSDAEAIGSLTADAILVAPAAVCLSFEEREAIRAHLENGGHLLATWALGARDEGCDWIGYDFLQEVAEAGGIGTLADREATYVTAPAGLPLSVGLPPGVRVELRNEPWVYLQTSGPAVYWSDWALNPIPATAGGASVAALARPHKGGGRLVWFGYRLDVGARAEDQAIIDHVAANAALWASGNVIAEVAPWPEAMQAALAVTQDVEHSFRNSRRLAERLREQGTPVTFFAVSQLVREHADLAEALKAAGEIGTHSVDHRQVAGRPFESQLAALELARADIDAWAGRPAVGFRPPREAYDAQTLEAWARVGGRYIAAANGARTAAPHVHQVSSGSVVVLPRVVDDDYSVIVVRGESSVDSLSAALHGALAKVRILGGLDLLTLHTQLIDTNRRMAVVEDVVREAREAGDVWIASAGEVAEWWLGRSNLVVDVETRADGSAAVSVRNDGATSVTAASLRVHLPDDGYAAPEAGEETLSSSFTPAGLNIRLPVLDAGQSIEILIPRSGV